MVMKDNPYDELLKDGEKFYPHVWETLIEIDDCINVIKACNRLPECYWEGIRDIHATNYASIYAITDRMINVMYPRLLFTSVKPNLEFLEWLRLRLELVKVS